MSSVDILADTTPIEHLDFDPPCEGPCHNTATWILWRVHCCPEAPPTVLVCDDCRRRLFEAPWTHCAFCLVAIFSPGRKAFHYSEPLKRGGRP